MTPIVCFDSSTFFMFGAALVRNQFVERQISLCLRQHSKFSVLKRQGGISTRDRDTGIYAAEAMPGVYMWLGNA